MHKNRIQIAVLNLFFCLLTGLAGILNAQPALQASARLSKNAAVSSSGGQNGEIEITIDSTRIREALPDRLKAWTIFEEKDGIYFIAKPEQKDSLFFYREGFSDFALEKVYALPSSYVDTMGEEMNSFHFQIVPVHKDTLIIFTWHTISMLALKKGKILNHYVFNHEIEEAVMVDRAGPLKWDPYRKVLPVMIVRSDNQESRRWNWDSELLGEFSLETGKLSILPVSYPQVREYTQPKLYNCLGSDPLITFSRDRYVVGFPGTPVVFSCDMRTHKTDSLYLQNPMYKPCPPYTMSVQWKKKESRHITLDVCDFRYTGITYDACRDVYYRFFVCDSLDFAPDGKVNDYLYCENGFTVLNKKLQMLGDAHWNARKVHSTAWYPTSKGIYGFAYRRNGNSCGNNRNGNIIKINWEVRK